VYNKVNTCLARYALFFFLRIGAKKEIVNTGFLFSGLPEGAVIRAQNFRTRS
jgi:hypothetical protein